MSSLPLFVLAGAVIGSLTGLFGVGGSSIATPLLSLMGVPPLAAVATPLPATVPSALLASIAYFRAQEVRLRAAAWTLAGGVPGTIAGAFASKLIGGAPLLVLSGLVLVLIGQRILRPIGEAMRGRGTQRRHNRPLLVMASAGLGFFTGLLANGGGFLLVPTYLLLFGLTMRQAVGTSLAVIAVLAAPTLAIHWSLGHIDWPVAGAYALGSIPSSGVSGRFAHRVEGFRARRAFGWFLCASGTAFVILRLAMLLRTD